MRFSAQRIAGMGSISLGGAVAISAVLGPTVLKVIKFRASPSIETQFVGGDIVSLVLVAPALVASGALWWRHHRLAPAVAIGPALYVAYTYVTVIGGQEYGRYSGNVEKFFPLYACILGGAVALAVYAWSRLPSAAIPPPSRGLRRAFTWVFVGIGGAVTLAWAAQIRAVFTGNPMSEYVDAPNLFWLIKMLDFGFCIPALVATGLGLAYRKPVAEQGAVAMAGFSTCLVAAIGGMAMAMQVRNDPSANPLMLSASVAATVGLGCATWRYLAAPSLANSLDQAAMSQEKDVAMTSQSLKMASPATSPPAGPGTI